MEIIINKCNYKKETIDESYGVMYLYKKLMKNPHSKIIKRSSRLNLKLGFIFIYLVFVLCFSIIYQEPIFILGLGIAIFAFLISLSKTIAWYKYLNTYSKTETNSILKIDEDKIELNNKVFNTISSIEWKEIKQILVTKYCIFFMPELEKNKRKNVINLSRDYKEQIIEAIEKYNKKDLLVFNI